METFQTNPVSLPHLLSSISERELALPDFQRDFVWDPRATEELIESIARSFPAGSLLFMPWRSAGLAVLAGFVAVLHLGAAATAAVMGRRTMCA